MRFAETKIPGAFLLEPELRADQRGHFARIWCAEEFDTRGLKSTLAQCNVSFNPHAGTLRGMHYQVAPREEAKVVRCIRGAVYDVLIDLRPSSPAFRQWVSAELDDHNGRMLYVPEGVAHGFQTLRENAEVLYLISESYSLEHARGVRWDDPAFGVRWPDAPSRCMSDRDRGYPDFRG
jgi:dTDP-4-dehydrorhamnose 3,5-epimerase